MSGQMTPITRAVTRMTGPQSMFVENLICLMAMTHRFARLRILTFVLGTLQLASPGASAIADGMLALASVGQPATHVEAVTQAACPLVHAPDCGLCRFLSLTGCRDAAPPSLAATETARAGLRDWGERNVAARSIALPSGRAPPKV
jgi:hypothetical protein